MEIIYHYIIYKLLSQYKRGWISLQRSLFNLGWHIVKNGIMRVCRTLSKIHTLYSTSNHGGCIVTHMVIHMFTAILIVHITACIIFSPSFYLLHLFLPYFSSFCCHCTLPYLFKVSWFTCGELSCIYLFIIFSSSYLSHHCPHYFITISSFCLILIHPFNSH
jgi:hypothetical protein